MQEILQRFTFFSYLLPAVHGDDIIMPPAIVVFPQASYSYYIILTDYSSYVGTYRNKNHIFCEKKSFLSLNFA